MFKVSKPHTCAWVLTFRIMSQKMGAHIQVTLRTEQVNVFVSEVQKVFRNISLIHKILKLLNRNTQRYLGIFLFSFRVGLILAVLLCVKIHFWTKFTAKACFFICAKIQALLRDDLICLKVGFENTQNECPCGVLHLFSLWNEPALLTEAAYINFSAETWQDQSESQHGLKGMHLWF